MISSPDRYLGCLIGLAYGDALGTTTEFLSRGSFEPYTNINLKGVGPFKLDIAPVFSKKSF